MNLAYEGVIKITSVTGIGIIEVRMFKSDPGGEAGCKGRENVETVLDECRIFMELGLNMGVFRQIDIFIHLLNV